MTAILVLVLRVIIAAGLLFFTGWAFYTIWRNLQLQSQAISQRTVPAMKIRWSTPTLDEERTFSQPVVLVGRGADCDVLLNEDTVSTRHARLSFHHNQWWVEDLGSTNFSFLNDERISSPTVIISGDEIRCGTVSLQVNIAEEA